MSETLERYKLEIVNNHGDRYIRCDPAPDGSWVMFRDVAALQKRCEEAERERDALRRDASQEIATDELVRRLQHLGDWQAADRIEALQARVAELEGAIRTAAECIDADDTIAARGFLSDVLIKKYKPKWVCPNNTPGCLKNCGNYGCGN